MASNSAIHRVELNVADMDRHHYADHSLTIARHPSETEERMMVRLLAYALWSHERLEFGRGISVVEEPDLWQRDLTGRIERWIDVGLPDERRIRQACGQSDEVIVLAYGGRTADLWWEKVKSEIPKGKCASGCQRSRNSPKALTSPWQCNRRCRGLRPSCRSSLP